MLHTADDSSQSFDPETLSPLAEFQGSLSQRTYQSLREAILTLRCPPGMVLRKADICERLVISRSPVSEAMNKLSAEGLVEIIPQAGTRVARFSMQDIREGAFLREALELAAIEHLTPLITDAQLLELRRNLRVQRATVEDRDTEEFYNLDASFHRLIHKFTTFQRLSAMADSAWANVDRARRLLLPLPGRMQDTLDEHQAILTALEARDPAAARTAMRAHLSKLLVLLAPLEKSHPSYFVSKDTP